MQNDVDTVKFILNISKSIYKCMKQIKSEYVYSNNLKFIKNPNKYFQDKTEITIYKGKIKFWNVENNARLQVQDDKLIINVIVSAKNPDYNIFRPTQTNDHGYFVYLGDPHKCNDKYMAKMIYKRSFEIMEMISFLKPHLNKI